MEQPKSRYLSGKERRTGDLKFCGQGRGTGVCGEGEESAWCRDAQRALPAPYVGASPSRIYARKTRLKVYKASLSDQEGVSGSQICSWLATGSVLERKARYWDTDLLWELK